MWTWISALSIDWCSRISSSTEFGHADDQHGGVDRMVGQRLDGVRHHGDRFRAADPIEFVEDDDQRPGDRQRLKRSPDAVGRVRIEGGIRGGRRRQRGPQSAEADARLTLGGLDVLERLGPERGIGVGNVAVRPRHDEGLPSRQERGDHVGERGLSRPPLAIEDRMTAALGHSVDDLQDLLFSAGEQFSFVDRRSRSEHCSRPKD